MQEGKLILYRRGNFKELIDEVRWELDMNGFKDVGITVSGGLDEDTVAEVADTCVTSFGVGTCIANAPTLDLSMDIVEKENVPISKRGKFGGRKYSYRCPDCLNMDVALTPDADIKCPNCGCAMEMIEKPALKDGKRVSEPRDATQIRDYVMKQLKQISEL